MNVVKGKVHPLRDKVLAADMNFEEQKTSSGIIIQSDDGKAHGVRPRWCRVWAIGPDQTEVAVGDWIYVEHGRWTRGMTVEDESGQKLVVRGIDNKAILLSSTDAPSDWAIGEEYNTSAPTIRPEEFM